MPRDAAGPRRHLWRALALSPMEASSQPSGETRDSAASAKQRTFLCLRRSDTRSLEITWVSRTTYVQMQVMHRRDRVESAAHVPSGPCPLAIFCIVAFTWCLGNGETLHRITDTLDQLCEGNNVPACLLSRDTRAQMQHAGSPATY